MHAASETAASSTPLAGSTLQVVRALALVALLMVWSAVSDVLSAHFQLENWGLSSPIGIALTLLGLLVTLGGIIGIGCVRLGKSSLRELGWVAPSLPRLVVLGLLQTALIVGLIFAVYGALAGLDGVRGLARAIASMPAGERLFYLVAGSKVAFVEETLFRGDLLGKLSLRTGKVAAVVLSSLAFALFHRTLAPIPLGMKFVLGVLFAVLTVRSRSLVPAAIAHALVWTIVGDN